MIMYSIFRSNLKRRVGQIRSAREWYHCTVADHIVLARQPMYYWSWLGQQIINLYVLKFNFLILNVKKSLTLMF
jgi:hypothetical protein